MPRAPDGALQLLPDGLRQHARALLDQLQPLIQAWRPDQEQLQAFTALAMQQWVAAAACVACLGLLLTTIAAGGGSCVCGKGSLVHPLTVQQQHSSCAPDRMSVTPQTPTHARLVCAVAHDHEGRRVLQGAPGLEQVRVEQAHTLLGWRALCSETACAVRVEGAGHSRTWWFGCAPALHRPKPEVKAQRQASMAAEIEKIKVNFSRACETAWHQRPAV
jgi:hypothetical protein